MTKDNISKEALMERLNRWELKTIKTDGIQHDVQYTGCGICYEYYDEDNDEYINISSNVFSDAHPYETIYYIIDYYYLTNLYVKEDNELVPFIYSKYHDENYLQLWGTFIELCQYKYSFKKVSMH